MERGTSNLGPGPLWSEDGALARGAELRSLLPEPLERVNLVEMYSRGVEVPAGRPFVRLNMISTLDGATTFAGRSGGLGGPADRLVFAVLRSLSDVVLVGAGTARAEHYGPAKLPPEVQRMRQERGQSAVPLIAVVTRSLNLDWESSLFRASSSGSLGPRPVVPGPVTPRPILIAPGSSDADDLARAGEVADVLTTGTSEVDLAAALSTLRQRGLRHLLCEGGPRLNTNLVAAQLVDELCLTLSPKLAGTLAGGLFAGRPASTRFRTSPGAGVAGGERLHPLVEPFARLLDVGLVHLLEEDGFLFLRLRPAYSGGSPAGGTAEPPASPATAPPESGTPGAPPSI
jgi:riboflavin biosynthesis pyrimidine reductase